MKDYKVGEAVNDEFLVVTCSVEMAKNNKPFVRLDLRDKEGTLIEKCKRFDCDETVEGVIKVAGTVQEYQGQKHIKINLWDKGESPISDFGKKAPWLLPKGKMLYDNILIYVECLSEYELRKWVVDFLNYVRTNQSILSIIHILGAETIYDGPAARNIHHAYQTGWMEHTLEVAMTASAIGNVYHMNGFLNHRELDLLIVGAIIHDVGKLYQFDSKGEYSRLAKAYGWHSNAEQIIGSHLLLQYCTVHGFPLNDPENFLILNNMICSHHGNQYSIAPAVYRISKLLHFADHISADMNRMSANLYMKDEVDRDAVRESYLKVKEYCHKEIDMKSQLDKDNADDTTAG